MTDRRPDAAADDVFAGPAPDDIVALDTAAGPYLVVIVDAEEEFDWTEFSPNATSVTSMGRQSPAQKIFERFGVVPTYVVDYPVAAQEEGYGPLKEYLDSGVCEIGAQLHPWVNPPIREAAVRRNTFPGNLDSQLEHDKLAALTAVIEDNFEHRPTIYRAGRWGIGRNTFEMLAALNYEIDCSVLPGADLRQSGGPDFRRCTVASPYWGGPRRSILELPVTAGYTGLLREHGSKIHSLASRPVVRPLHLPGILAHCGLLDRMRLSPEGIPLTEAMHLTRVLMQRAGQRVFCLSYHTPSLVPGNTPYVSDAKDLARFLGWLEGYLEFFFGVLGGRASTAREIRALAQAVRR
jgi:hypothetical protein